MFGYKVPAPDEAMLISGGRAPGNAPFRVVTGHGAYIMPFFRKVRFLTLAMCEAEVAEKCVTQQGITLNVRAVIAFKVGNDDESVVSAGQRFLSDQEQMAVLTGRIFAGHLRSIIGSMTVEQIIRVDSSKMRAKGCFVASSIMRAYAQWMGLTLAERRAITETAAARYQRASKGGKGRILDELCANTGWHRSHARKALKAALQPKILTARRVWPVKYGPDVIAALTVCWAVLGMPAGKRLAPLLSELVAVLRHFG